MDMPFSGIGKKEDVWKMDTARGLLKTFTTSKNSRTTTGKLTATYRQLLLLHLTVCRSSMHGLTCRV